MAERGAPTWDDVKLQDIINARYHERKAAETGEPYATVGVSYRPEDEARADVEIARREPSGEPIILDIRAMMKQIKGQ